MESYEYCAENICFELFHPFTIDEWLNKSAEDKDKDNISVRHKSMTYSGEVSRKKLVMQLSNRQKLIIWERVGMKNTPLLRRAGL